MKNIILLILVLFILNEKALSANRTIEADYITNVFSQSNFVKNPNARANTQKVTASAGFTVARSTTTPLYDMSEFVLSSTGTSGTIDWQLRDFDKGMKGQNCEARFTYRGFSGGETRVFIVQATNVATALLLPSTDPKQVSINFPCGDLSTSTTFRIMRNAAAFSGTNEIGGIYLGLATNMANVAQAEFVGSWRMVGTSGCTFSITSTSFDQFPVTSACNSPVTTGSVLATQGKRPWIDISNPKAGNYYVIAKGSFHNPAANQNQYMRLTAVKSAGNESSSQLRTYASASSAIFPASLSMNTSFSSGTLGFVIEGFTSNAASAIQLINDSANTDITFEVYRFPTSSELVVKPEAQNVWGGVVYTNQAQSLFASLPEPTAQSPFTSATWNQPSLLKGKAKVTTTNSGNDLGFSIENLPVGSYKLDVTGLLNATVNSSTTVGDLSVCNFKVIETTTSTEVSKQMHIDQSYSTAGVDETRNYVNAFTGIFNNTSSGTRNFRIEAQKTFDTSTGNISSCQAFSATASNANSSNIAMIITPLDQPSNSSLYVQGPVLGAQTGAAIPSGYVGESFSENGTTNMTISTSSAGTSTTLATKAIGAGSWLLIPSIHCKETSAMNSANVGIRIGAFLSTSSVAFWPVSLDISDGAVGFTQNFGNGSEFSVDVSGVPLFVSLSSPTTYYLRGSVYNNLSGGSGVCRGSIKGIRLN